MGNLILYIVAAFFLVGTIDYIIGDKLKLGRYFEEGIKNMGPLSISMVGIISLTPVITDILNKFLVPISEKIGIDPSIFISSIIAIDMGAFNISQNIALNENMMYFSGVLMASILGCTISFTLPLALGIIKKEDRNELFLGILFGVIGIPIGLFFGGLLLNISLKVILINLLPIIFISLVLGIGIILNGELTINILSIVGKIIVFISMIGFGIVGIQSISGITLFNNLMPLGEALSIVGKIGIFLGGAYVMVEVIKRVLSGPLDRIALKLGVNNHTVGAFLGSLASAIIIFSSFHKLDSRGKILCSAFSVGGAYVLGGQLAFVSSESPKVVGIYIFTKLFCGFIAMFFGILYIRIKEKNLKLKD